jgi:hypothetical protein
MAEEALPEIGYTGARFGGGGRKRRRAVTAVPKVAERVAELAAAQPAESVVTESVVTEPEAPTGGRVVGHTGARFGGPVRDPDPAPVSTPVPPPAAGPPAVEWPLHRDVSEAPEPVPNMPSSIRVRPYILTGGRTRADIELELETLVSVGPQPPQQHYAVVALCRRPISVAEVAALMGVPLGVARVIVGDLAAQGALIVHAAGMHDIPDVGFLQRVLTGLRRL